MSIDVLCKLKSLWKTVFGDPDFFIDNFFKIAYSPERCRYIEENGQILSALYWFDCAYEGGKLAYIYAVATHPDYRGKGLASNLIRDTHDYLKSEGYAGAVLKPANGLFPFYERLGYVTSGHIRRFSASASKLPIQLKALSPREYGLLRKSYLPKNAVIQEGVTLEFLHTFANFYAAEDALICVSPEETFIFEYLGNPDSAPGILATLGIESANIPTCGETIPFTMYYPLNCTKIPGYLGITLE